MTASARGIKSRRPPHTNPLDRRKARRSRGFALCATGLEPATTSLIEVRACEPRDHEALVSGTDAEAPSPGTSDTDSGELRYDDVVSRMSPVTEVTRMNPAASFAESKSDETLPDFEVVVTA